MASVYRTNTWVIPRAITESDSDPSGIVEVLIFETPFATTLFAS